ncbi:SdrD B-like domain-containing protein [Streptomyces neyagawaensis]|uniref:SdrD B-like domain-containing protein n=1 Tax=Streptomyces neyagawaensis TaxID=42238 RepID=UPI001F0AB37B|nr:SdrD B-like domain-containing protein [Streptomyces neyagawaensis]MCL6734644.1 SpaA isopeptide-forming pilin-related protein [Streptomyces neyagawaensis]MDE1682193.1 SdrD B-like domain-containing protein [Streptomyces neyagawaensis]
MAAALMVVPVTGTAAGATARGATVVGATADAATTGSATTRAPARGDGTVTVRVVEEVDADGLYDRPTEKGMPGVLVTLTDDHGTVLTRTTDADGTASFRPAGSPLRGGRYRVQAHNPDLANLHPALAGHGDGPDVIRSPIGFVDVSDARDTTYTTGFWAPGVHRREHAEPGPEGRRGAPVQIGDRVWFDTDGNGVQNPSEPPVPGVRVTFDPTSSGPSLTTTTDADGEYYVGTAQGLRPDTTYRVSFDHGGVDPSGLPGRPGAADLTWTAREAGSHRLIDSDVDVSGRSTVYVGEPGYVNHTVDAGLTKALRLTLAKADAETRRPLAGAVLGLWEDSNGTPGLQRLGPGGDRLVGDCVTSSTGRCSFGSLPAGTYYLMETGVPEGYVLPAEPVTGPYALTPKNASRGTGLLVRLDAERG